MLILPCVHFHFFLFSIACVHKFNIRVLSLKNTCAHNSIQMQTSTEHFPFGSLISLAGNVSQRNDCVVLCLCFGRF